MKKLIVIIGVVTGTLLMSCSAKVVTPVGGAGVKVGSAQPAKFPGGENRNSESAQIK